MTHEYLAETQALIDQARADIAAEELEQIEAAEAADEAADIEPENQVGTPFLAGRDREPEATDMPTEVRGPDWVPASRTDTTPADNQQLAHIFAAVAARQETPTIPSYDSPFLGAEDPWVGRNGINRDPQWAGPSLPHPSEAGSEEEADELRQGWDDEVHGIEPNQEAQL